jgi:hypothetical protein
MRIASSEDLLEIEVVDRVSANLPTPNDVELSIEVASDKYRGHAFAWVASAEMNQFIAQLRELERTRTGSAQLTGMSPTKFRLRIYILDRQGHVALEGWISHSTRGQFMQSLEFAFEFDPTSLPKILANYEAIAVVQTDC